MKNQKGGIMIETWIKSKQTKWLLLLGVLQGFIFFNGILPSYENLEYFQEKVKKLKLKQASLNRFVGQMDYYQKDFQQFSQKKKNAKGKTLLEKDPFLSFEKLGHTRRQKFQFENWTQEVGEVVPTEFFLQLEVSQNFVGRYQEHRDYLNAVFNLPQGFILTHYSLKNKNWESLNKKPLLQGDMKITFLQTKK